MLADSAVPHIGSMIRAHRCIPFCGAGISIGSELPTARQFLQEAGLEGVRWSDAMTIRQSVEPQFYTQFLRTFGRPSLKPNEQHRYIALLDAPFTITTNYDLLLERAFSQVYGQEVEERLGVIRRSSHLSKISHHRNILVKFHGDVDDSDDPELLVITREHYTRRLSHPTLVDDFVRCLFSTYSILFIGYSLSDDNIVSILDERNRLASRYLPESYILLTEHDSTREIHLGLMGVKPIYLTTVAGDRQAAVTDFLHRLWEQRPGHAEFVWLHSRKSTNLKEVLDQALELKENGKLQDAHRLLSVLDGQGIDWAAEGTLAETFLYLAISVRDKLEVWEELQILDKTLFPSILAGLRRVSPGRVYDSICGIYQGSMALAMLRAGELEDAAGRIDEALHRMPTSTAGSELQIQYANLLVTRAMINLSMWARCPESIDSLAPASSDIDAAGLILGQHGGEGKARETHHLGRFHGASAFLSVAGYPVLDGALREKILRHSQQSHDGSQRTSFGRIAGLYCDAFCRFSLSQSTDEPSVRTQLLRQARELTDRALDALGPGHVLPRLKFKLLVECLGNETVSEGGSQRTREAFADEDFQTFLKKYKKLGELALRREWLGTPLN